MNSKSRILYTSVATITLLSISAYYILKKRKLMKKQLKNLNKNVLLSPKHNNWYNT